MSDKFCINCQHCFKTGVPGPTIYRCKQYVQYQSLVTGEITYHECDEVRTSFTYCGPEGRKFVDRKKAANRG